MVVASSSQPPILTHLRVGTTTYLTSPLPVPPLSYMTPAGTANRRRSPVIVLSQKSRDAITQNDRKELFERYGLDPSEFLSQPTPSPTPRKSRRNEHEKNTGKGKDIPEEDHKQHRRTTHKLLQVLGGTAKRKKLLSPAGMDVRPMMEVVKGAAFDILQVAGGCPASLRPGRWLDLYSGTGSVGIEALSRGCSEVHFVEMDPWVVSDVLRPNLEWTGFIDVSVVHTVRVESFLERAQHFVGEAGTFDYISVTPPYTQVDYGLLMSQIASSAVVGENTFVLVEYPFRTSMLDSCGGLSKIAYRRFGRTHLAIYGPKWAEKKKKVRDL